MRMTLAQHEPELIAATRAGSGEALGQLYVRHADTLMAVACRLTGSTADAEDVLHDVFLGLPEALIRYEERGAFGAWLRQLTARVALTRMRSPTRAREMPFDDSVLAADEPSADTLGDRVTIEAALARLPDATRVVFVLKMVEGYPHARIAEMLGISVGASEVRLVRAMKMMRHLLGNSR